MTTQSTTGFMLEIAAGVAGALLFAPYSGAKTQALLARNARDMKKKILSQIDEAGKSTTDLLERGKDEVARHQEGFRRAFEAGSEAYRNAIG